MPTVMRMWEFWAMEPPVGKLMALRYGYGLKETRSSLPPGMAKSPIPFRRLPRWLQLSMIKKSGLSEVEYFRKLNEEARAKYAKETS